MDIVTIIEEGGVVIAVLLISLIILKLCSKYRVQMKCCGMSIDFRKPSTRQKEIESDSSYNLRKLKLEEMRLRIKEKEIALDVLKLQYHNSDKETNLKTEEEKTEEEKIVEDNEIQIEESGV